MALIEEDIGPDRISGMTTKVILHVLIDYTLRMCGKLGIATKPISFTLANGERFSGSLPQNPHLTGSAPVILVPCDTLRELPIATC